MRSEHHYDIQIWVGGIFSEKTFTELLALVNEHGFLTEDWSKMWDMELLRIQVVDLGEVLQLNCREMTIDEASEVGNTLRKLGLSYRMQIDGDHEYPPLLRFYNPDDSDKEREMACDHMNSGYIPIHTIEKFMRENPEASLSDFYKAESLDLADQYPEKTYYPEEYSE
jgi:hypothetical protein